MIILPRRILNKGSLSKRSTSGNLDGGVEFKMYSGEATEYNKKIFKKKTIKLIGK